MQSPPRGATGLGATRWSPDALRPPVQYPVVLLAVLALTVVRSAVVVFWEGAHFQANEAVFGLMAKHLAEGRAFPVFMYGQNYMLAVESWLAAPLFVAFGPSVTALKLPLLAMNLVAAWLLVRVLVRDAGLAPSAAALASVFFVLPAPGTVSRLLEASGGTFEPLLYVLLLWITRARPWWCGLVLGIGLLNREFTAYGFAALVIIGLARGGIFTLDGLRRLAITLAVAGALHAAAQVGRTHGPAMGPGTRQADMGHDARKPLELATRLCIDLPAVPRGLLHIATIHWPLLFGTAVTPIRHFETESNAVQGAPGAGLVLGLAMLLAAARVAWQVGRARTWSPDFDPCAYLVLTGALSVSGYVLTRCGVVAPITMRYDMLSILGAVGLSAWFLHVERRLWIRRVWIVLVLAWVAVIATAHVRLWAEYVPHAPIGGKRAIVRALEVRGIRYVIAPYATAYPVAFLSDERIVASSTNRVRILEYEREVSAHRREAVRIGHDPCVGGDKALGGVYFCPPDGGR